MKGTRITNESGSYCDVRDLAYSAVEKASRTLILVEDHLSAIWKVTSGSSLDDIALIAGALADIATVFAKAVEVYDSTGTEDL